MCMCVCVCVQATFGMAFSRPLHLLPFLNQQSLTAQEKRTRVQVIFTVLVLLVSSRMVFFSESFQLEHFKLLLSFTFIL